MSTEPLRKWVPIDECLDGHTYRILARNAHVGIYNAERKWFVISRVKFGNNYVSEEIHWDADPHYGTAKPLELIEKAPELKTDEEILKYLNEKEKIIPSIPYEEYKLYE